MATISTWLGDRSLQTETLASLSDALSENNQAASPQETESTTTSASSRDTDLDLLNIDPLTSVDSIDPRLSTSQSEKPTAETSQDAHLEAATRDETLESVACWLGETPAADPPSRSQCDSSDQNDCAASASFPRQKASFPVLRLGFAPALYAGTSAPGISPESVPEVASGVISGIASSTPPASPVSRSRSPMWYLGLDLGSSGISAVLLNRRSRRLYPLYWRTVPLSTPAAAATPTSQSFQLLAPSTKESESDRWFRLPVRVLFTPQPSNQLHTSPTTPSPSETSPRSVEPVTLMDVKPLLTLGIPHFSSHTGQWEPTVQWSSHQTLSLKAVQQALQTLLVTLTRTSSGADAVITGPARIASSDAAEPDLGLICGAVGLGDDQLQLVLRHLAQVVLSAPSGWPDEYLMNLQDLILRLDLVRADHQIRWADEAIATVVSELEPADGVPIQLPPRLTPQQRARQRHWQGTTLVLNAGSAVTHLAIAHLPQYTADLQPKHFTTQSIAFAGQGLDQDIITQLLYPIWSAVVNSDIADPPPRRSGEAPLAVLSSDGWQALALDQCSRPTPGREDPSDRHRFQQHLHSSTAGQQLLELARLLKVSLQQREEVVIVIDHVPFTLSRQGLSDRVLDPYIQLLDTQIETLMQRFSHRWTQEPDAHSHAITPIQQIVCSGGTASLRTVALWLRKRFPTATIVQDTYSPATGSAVSTSSSARHREAASTSWHTHAQQFQTTYTCSRTAYGLAMLPLHPALIEARTRAYADYFLLSELLQVMSDAPVDVQTIYFKLAQRGIQVEVCRDQILALLNGRLPPGIQAGGQYQSWLANPTRPPTVDLESMTLTGMTIELFEQVDSQTYRVIPDYQVAFQRYLSTLFVAPAPRAHVQSPSLIE